MTETPPTNIYKSKFPATYETDVILMVDGNNLHVNKSLLSYHSVYFDELFNSEKCEFEIENVNFEDFVTVLSFVHPEPLKPNAGNAKRLRELANRFQLPGAERHLELFLMTTNKISRLEKLRIAAKMCDTSRADFYETTFAETDNTDVALVIDGKKLHVNKAHLSAHSWYFNILFNSEFKEKSMKEIPILDVKFEDFAIMLSLIHPYPYWPYDKEFEPILHLADRFYLPSVYRHVELVLMDSKSIEMDKFEKIRIADKYRMDELFEKGAEMFTERRDFHQIGVHPVFVDLSGENRSRIIGRLREILEKEKKTRSYILWQPV